jgi:hypothetical protein
MDFNSKRVRSTEDSDESGPVRDTVASSLTLSGLSRFLANPHQVRGKIRLTTLCTVPP